MVFPASLPLFLIFFLGLDLPALQDSVMSSHVLMVGIFFFMKVALRNDSILWMHTDPVSRMNESVEVQVIESNL